MNNTNILMAQLTSNSVANKQMIDQLSIVGFGIIQEIPDDGVVLVQESAADNVQANRVFSCTYANIASAALTLHVVPKIGDKVAILCPRCYTDEMFDVKKDSVIVDSDTSPVFHYAALGAIAIPINQYRENDHYNFITINPEGNFEVHLCYDEANSMNHLVSTVSEQGAITWESGTLGDDKTGITFSATESGVIDYTQGTQGDDKTGTTAHVDENGAFVITQGLQGDDKTGITITADENGAIQLTQGKQGDDKSGVTLSIDENGAITIEQGQDSDNGITFSLDEKGAIEFQQKNSDGVHFTLSEDGKLSYENSKTTISVEEDKINIDNGTTTIALEADKLNYDNGTAKLDIESGKIAFDNSQGAFTIDGGKMEFDNKAANLSIDNTDLTFDNKIAKIEATTSGMNITGTPVVGMLNIGSDGITIGGILDSLLQELMKMSTVGSPASHTVNPANIANFGALLAQVKMMFG